MALLVLGAQAVAQSPPPPTAQNVIPDGITYTVRGKLTSLDAAGDMLTVTPDGQQPVTMTIAPGVDLSDVEQGDVADVHYTRHVTFAVGNAGTSGAGNMSVGQAAQNPEAIANSPTSTVIIGRIVKINGPNSVDVVNNNGGGVYTIKTTQQKRIELISHLKVGDTLAVHVSPMIATSVAKCGLLGRGIIGGC
ncbi:MAG: hypothetical protein ACJ8AW_07815 [Rhodopila sp.]